MLEVDLEVQVDTPFSRAVRRVAGGKVHVPAVLRRRSHLVLPFVARGADAMAEALRSASPDGCCRIEIDDTWSNVVEGRLMCEPGEDGCFLARGGLDMLSEALGGDADYGGIEVLPDATRIRTVVVHLDGKADVVEAIEGIPEDLDLELLDVTASPITPDAQTSGGSAGTLLETLKTAVRMGYYESPRGCTMEDIATTLGITKSAVYHRMNKVERVAVTRLYEDEQRRPGSDEADPSDFPHVE